MTTEVIIAIVSIFFTLRVLDFNDTQTACRNCFIVLFFYLAYLLAEALQQIAGALTDIASAMAGGPAG